MLIKIMARFPILEVLVRILYWRFSFLNSTINFILKNMKNYNIKKKESIVTVPSSLLIKYINELGIKKGDCLIVHSSFAELKCFGLTPDEIVDLLIEIVGEEGNLIMPAIPIIKGEPKPIDRFNLKNYKTMPLYNVQKSRVWTGILPQTLLKRKGALRSRSPLNSMVVYGKNSHALIDYKLFGMDSLACGVGSVLGNSLEFNSKILFLGVDEVHSMTMIHAAEDLYNESWPVKNWYWKRDFKIVDCDFNQVLNLRERNPKWALFYTEKRFSADLFKYKILNRKNINNLNISVCVSSELISFLRSKNAKGYPYFIPFWHLKRNKNV